MRSVTAVVTALLALTGARADPENLCCLADQVTAKQVQTYINFVQGNYEFGVVTSYFSYDAANEREVYVSHRSDNLGPTQEFVYYLFYQTNTMYTYHNMSGMCVQFPLNRPFHKLCVPASAEIDHKLTYGAGTEDETFEAMRVMYNMTRSDGLVLENVLTATMDCVPVLKQFVVQVSGGIKSESIEFTNLEIGNVPESVFDLPVACAKAPVAPPMTVPNLSYDDIGSVPS